MTRAAARYSRLPRLRALLLVASLCCVLGAALPAVASAGAIMQPAGFDTNSVARGDDNTVQVVNLPFSMNWFGANYTQIYINQNGNCTFGQNFTGYNPSASLVSQNRDIMAPFWGDVDTRVGGQTTYSRTATPPTVDGHPAFFVNWIGVGYYNQATDKLNSFQLVLVDRSDTGAGNFDFYFNYDNIDWDIGTTASTYKARAGWARSAGSTDFFELPGSGVTQATASTLLDNSPAATSLIQNSLNSGGVLARYVWQVRNGAAPNVPPVLNVTNRTLEGNSQTPSPGYEGYTGTGDAVATDPDGTIASLTNDRPAYLPLGTTTVLWTATDNRGRVTTATQTIVVRDTTAPTNPTLSSPSHTIGAWSESTSARVQSAGTADTCSGASGFSYSWTRNAPGTPAAVSQPLTINNITNTTTTTVDTQTFPNATWPAGWTRSSTTYIRLTNAAGRTHGTYAAELYASSNTRRTFDFYHDYDLSGFTSASLDFWDQVSTLSGGGDYARVEYSTNGGTSYTQLQNLTSASVWQPRHYDLPTGGTVRVRFAGSVAAATEYADWDDITVTGYTTTTTTQVLTDTTNTLTDGTWYYNLRAVDAAGNWSSPVSLGPVLIDTVPPVTTDNVPSAWQKANFPVTLTATDAGVVAHTFYKLNGAATATYAASVLISNEGTNTLLYWSVDAAGHVEATKTATIRLDRGAPTAPGAASGSAISTTAATITWTASTDAVSGIDHYAVYRDGVLVGTTTAVSYTETGLTSGQTYVYTIKALDAAGNASPSSIGAPVTMPIADLWLDLSAPSVGFGSVDPGVLVARNGALVVTVGGVGTIGYDLTCRASDFTNADSGSPTPTMAINILSYVTTGWKTKPSTSFTNGDTIIDSSIGTNSSWSRPYTFDYTLAVPWAYSPGTYATSVTYTVVQK